MRDWGRFIGDMEAQWLVGTGPDRDMRVLRDLVYQAPGGGRTWKAPAESIVNGASIPRPLWAIVGSPYVGDYRRASVVHDVACNTPTVPRKEADRMFHSACRADGCGRTLARILYIGVRIGAWLSSKAELKHLHDSPVVWYGALPAMDPGVAMVVDAYQRACYLSEHLAGESEEDLDAIDRIVEASARRAQCRLDARAPGQDHPDDAGS